MAKRKRLGAPDTEEVARYAESITGEQPPMFSLGPSAPPIARVAHDVSQRAADEVVEARRSAAANEADATRWRAAEAEGRVTRCLKIGEIETEHLARDRLVLEDAEMAELRTSIQEHGLRMPIEVVQLSNVTVPGRYGLISGWRRLQAVRSLWAETGDERFSTVNALVRKPKDTAAAYVAMVEENEIRADLSHYERGRVAVVAAGQGAFSSVEAAVEALFSAGSKAKRSKIRSFAQIHEVLGDLLRYGPSLSERAGLRLAQALREKGSEMRQALATLEPASPEAEWRSLEPLILDAEGQRGNDKTASNITRPKAHAVVDRREVTGGVVVEIAAGRDAVSIRLKGSRVSDDLVEHLVGAAERFLADKS